MGMSRGCMRVYSALKRRVRRLCLSSRNLRQQISGTPFVSVSFWVPDKLCELSGMTMKGIARLPLIHWTRDDQLIDPVRLLLGEEDIVQIPDLPRRQRNLNITGND